MQETGLEDQTTLQEKSSGEAGNDKNGAEPGRSRTRNSHLKALQYVPEGLSSFVNWAQMWMMGLANKAETRLWLRANIVSLKRTKLRPIALLETHQKLIEPIAVDQHADQITALMQEQQAEFKSGTEQKR